MSLQKKCWNVMEIKCAHCADLPEKMFVELNIKKLIDVTLPLLVKMSSTAMLAPYVKVNYRMDGSLVSRVGKLLLKKCPFCFVYLHCTFRNMCCNEHA